MWKRVCRETRRQIIKVLLCQLTGTKTEVLEETDETSKETADAYSVDDNELAVHVNINRDSTTGKLDFYA